MAPSRQQIYLSGCTERDYFIRFCVWLDPALPSGDDNEEDIPEFTEEELEYCRKVRESQGFDLDMDDEQMEKVHIPFKIRPFKVDVEGRTTLNPLVSHALLKQKEKKGKVLRIEGITKCNVQHVPDGIRYFITFKAKDLKEHCLLGPQEYQSRIFVVRDGDEDIIVTEVFRLKPSPPVSSSLGLCEPAPATYRFSLFA